MKEFEVISSNPSNEGKSFVTKLHHEETVVTVFGSKSKRETYYVSGSKQLEVGKKVSINLEDWRIQEYPYTNESTGETMILKWLHLK